MLSNFQKNRKNYIIIGISGVLVGVLCAHYISECKRDRKIQNKQTPEEKIIEVYEKLRSI